MSAELRELFEAAGRDEVAAAQREFPLTEDALRGYVRAAGRRRVAVSAALAVGGVVAAGGVAFGAVQFWPDSDADIVAAPSPSVSWSESASASPTASASPSTSPSPSPSPSVTPSPSAPAETTEPPPPPADPPAVVLPGPVTGVSAGPGGGSGEVVVNWDAVEGATGYRVYRASTSDGDFGRSAGIVVATGATSIYFGGSYEYIQIWQSSDVTFQYVEVVDGAAGYFRVAAFNDAGTGPKSGVVCGAPPGAEGC